LKGTIQAATAARRPKSNFQLLDFKESERIFFECARAAPA
jgi:hypothetical protein